MRFRIAPAGLLWYNVFMTYHGEKKKEYDREWVAKRRAEWFADKCCVVCGATERLELDHINPPTKDPKLKPGTGLWSWSKERREIELAKCQVLCHQHHLEKTARDYAEAMQHGTSHMYDKYGCRCEDCVAAVRAGWTLRNGRKSLRRKERKEAKILLLASMSVEDLL